MQDVTLLAKGCAHLLQTVIYDLFKRTLGGGPVYAALGNHDTYNQ